MPAVLGTPRETFPGGTSLSDHHRVIVESLRKSGLEVLFEYGASLESGYPDEAYAARGATLGSREQVFAQSHIVVQVRSLGANAWQRRARADLALLRPGHVTLVGFGEPTDSPQAMRWILRLPERLSWRSGVESPRITRAQSMDVLSAMATILRLPRGSGGRHHSATPFPHDDHRCRNHCSGESFCVGSGGRRHRLSPPRAD